MNIKEASEQIKGAIRAYLAKDEYGMYRIPFKMQRPIIMLGPPGLGKTAIVEQIAEELDINFVSYSITHHTRQSALGLPFIAHEDFDGVEYSVSEYTMSEIIAAVYRERKSSGVNEGILFLDEVNCVSETLAPAMLQFLQYKTFGMHRLPEGWIIVTAGNPPEYNRAARQFDPAMLDRLMKIDIEPDLAVWQEYAVSHGIHPAITTYLDTKPSCFYDVRADARGFKIVTSRGWEDLSRMLLAYEAEGMEPPASLPERYLQDACIAEDFSVYYELFRKYRDDFRAAEILAGKAGEAAKQRAAQAPFDERIALVGLLIDANLFCAHEAVQLEEALKSVRSDLLELKSQLKTADDSAAVVAGRMESIQAEGGVGKRLKGQAGDAAVIKAERLRVLGLVVIALRKKQTDAKDAFDVAKAVFNMECATHAEKIKRAIAGLDNSFIFLDETLGEGSQEALIFITKLSADPLFVRLVARSDSKEYLKHNKSLLFSERNLQLVAMIDELDLPESAGGVEKAFHD